ncbi:hypothetical protein FA95DRAFT_1482608 [Auriscalpium vulgare]|uniref:Uncharacterized protein n=1 Tax=Auriscalpium vulgare TaxID=40419 RepID=A0ACB8SA11_9AGAM|nr:hypothetical protein FA95DRAFT_1482608 [Auriscalpium vulgare]
MDRFLTVTKPSRQFSARDDGKNKSRPKHRFNPYHVDQSEDISYEKWRSERGHHQYERTLHVKHPTHATHSLNAANRKASSSKITRQILNTLSDESNPITHSDVVSRADHVVSSATGHQRSEHRINLLTGLRPTSEQYFSLRNKKIKEQAAQAEGTILSGVRVYINGYLRDTTDIEMKRLVSQAGGQVLPTSAGATHILTSQQLSGSKTQKLLTTKPKIKVQVVRPEWVFESVEAGKRLPEGPYAVVTDGTSRKLADMFGEQAGGSC